MWLIHLWCLNLRSNNSTRTTNPCSCPSRNSVGTLKRQLVTVVEGHFKARSPDWRCFLVPPGLLHPGRCVGRNRSGRCDSVASTNCYRPLSPMETHVTAHSAGQTAGINRCCLTGVIKLESIDFYLEDFILQHWQLIGVPCHKLVADFGIFPVAGHRPVETCGTFPI